LPLSRIVVLSEVRTRSVQTQSKGSAVRGLGTAAREQQVPPLRFNTLPTISRIVILSEVRTRSVQTQSKGSAVRGLDTAARDRRSLYSG